MAMPSGIRAGSLPAPVWDFIQLFARVDVSRDGITSGARWIMIKSSHIFSLAMRLSAVFLLARGASSAQNWVQADGIPAKEIIWVTDHRGDIYAISLDSVYRSPDSGTTWLPTPVQPGHGDNLVTMHSYGEYVYLGTTNDGVYRSSDGGAQWAPWNEGYPGSTVVEFLTLGDSLYVGTAAYGIFVRNTTQPSAWTSYNEGLERFGVETMATSGDLLLANVGLSTYARMRGGDAWAEFLVDSAGGQLSVNRFYRFGNYLFAGVGLGVYRGNPDATGWQKVGINLLPFRPVEHFAAHGHRLFAAVPYRLEHFICYSDDEGASWGVWAHELVQLLSMRVVGNGVFAARTDGLWYFDLGAPLDVSQPEVDRPDAFRLEQNYPNPFNPLTIIKYTVGRVEGRGTRDEGRGTTEAGAGGWGLGAGSVRLVVYDMLGREVVTLVNERKAAGSYEVRFDASGLSSGAYYYRLTAGGFSQTRAMMLVR